MTDGLLTEQEAADWLALSAGTLRKWRTEGKGPPYLRLPTGTIRYPQEGLVAWTEAERITPG